MEYETIEFYDHVDIVAADTDANGQAITNLLGEPVEVFVEHHTHGCIMVGPIS